MSESDKLFAIFAGIVIGWAAFSLLTKIIM